MTWGGPWTRLWRRLWPRWSVRYGAAVLVVVLTVAAMADCLAAEHPLIVHHEGIMRWMPKELSTLEWQQRLGPNDWLLTPPVPWGPNQQDKGYVALAAPSGRHFLGTDHARRDVAARIVHGTRAVLLVSAVAVSICIVLGVALGLVGAYFGSWIDGLVTRVVETLMAIPVFFLILAVVGILESQSPWTLSAVIGCVYWTRLARLVRAEGLRLRELEFVQAAKALGCSAWQVMWRHMAPNALTPVLVFASFGLAGATLIEAALSFLGFGLPDNIASWGGLMRGAMGHPHAWWLAVFPGLGLFFLVSAYHFLGDALREALATKAHSPARPL